MNIKNEIGSKFYRVEYRGVITECEIIDYENGDPVYGLPRLTDFRNDEYKLNKDLKRPGSSNYPLELAISKPNEYFDDLKKAKIKSLERFEKEVNPNGKYKVARYFDDMFEVYVTEILTKKEANIKAEELNKTPRHYVYYSVSAV